MDELINRGNLVPHNRTEVAVLVSFQLCSKHPQNLIGLFDNLEQLANDPTAFEVLVKADTEDIATQEFLAAEAPRRKFRLRALITPRRRGYEDLWEALNELYRLTDPSAYFVCNVNDEVRIREQGWDERLRRYVGLFPDHIFRLRTSKLKFRNYYDFWECGFAPENYAFFTKRWLDICGDWNPCFGPDSCQQYIAYYLGYGNYPSIKQYNRDVPVLDISWRNEGVGLNLSELEQQRRTAANFRLWARQVSHPMQEELYRRARLLQAHIVQAENAPYCPIEIEQDRRWRMILLRDARDGALLDMLPYKISRVGLMLGNLRRNARYTFFAGGGRDARNLLPISIVEFLLHRHVPFRTFVNKTSPRAFFYLCGSSVRSGISFISLHLTRPLGRGARNAVIAVRLAVRRFARLCRHAGRGLAAGRRYVAAGLRQYWIGRILIGPPRAVVDMASKRAARMQRRQRFRQVLVTLAAPPARIARRGLRLLARILRRLVRIPLAILSGWWWHRHGHRASLALMDLDHRWFGIKDAHRSRLPALRDPWLDPPEVQKEHRAPK